MTSVAAKDAKGCIIEQVVFLNKQLLIICEDEKFLIFETYDCDIEQADKLVNEMDMLRYGLITKDKLSKNGQMELKQLVEALKTKRDKAHKEYNDINEQLDNLT